MNLIRAKIIERALPKAKYLGALETNEGELHLLQLGRLVIGGSPTNSAFLVSDFMVREEWEDPAQAYVEEFDVQLYY